MMLLFLYKKVLGLAPIVPDIFLVMNFDEIRSKYDEIRNVLRHACLTTTHHGALCGDHCK